MDAPHRSLLEVPSYELQNPCSRHGREALDCAVLPVVFPSQCDKWWASGGVAAPPFVQSTLGLTGLAIGNPRKQKTRGRRFRDGRPRVRREKGREAGEAGCCSAEKARGERKGKQKDEKKRKERIKQTEWRRQSYVMAKHV